MIAFLLLFFSSIGFASEDVCDAGCYSDVNDQILTDLCCVNENGASFVGFLSRNNTETYGSDRIIQFTPNIANIVLVKPVLVPGSNGEYKFILEILDTISDGTQINVYVLPEFTSSTATNVTLLVDTIATAQNYTTIPIFRIPIGSKPAKYEASATEFVKQMEELGLEDKFVAVQLVSDETIQPLSDVAGYAIAEIEIVEETEPFPTWGYILIGVGGAALILLLVYCLFYRKGTVQVVPEIPRNFNIPTSRG